MSRYEFDGEPYVVIERHDAGISNFLLGAALGVGLALLVAPRSGAATRSMMRQRARGVRDRLLDAADDVAETVEARAEEARARLQHRIGDARDAMQRGRRQVVDAVDAGLAAAGEARAELERRIADSKAARDAGARRGFTAPPSERSMGNGSAGSGAVGGAGAGDRQA